jgi:hypothetical protein
VDLSAEQPTRRADAHIEHRYERESSGLYFTLELRHLMRATIRMDIKAPVAWAAPLTAVVLALAITAAILVPRLILPGSATVAAVVSVAGVSGGVVLVAGLMTMAHLLRRRD